MCPGISFGITTVELALAQLLYHFGWKLPNEVKPEELDMTENIGSTCRRKNDLYLIATTRIPFLIETCSQQDVIIKCIRNGTQSKVSVRRYWNMLVWVVWFKNEC